MTFSTLNIAMTQLFLYLSLVLAISTSGGSEVASGYSADDRQGIVSDTGCDPQSYDPVGDTDESCTQRFSTEIQHAGEILFTFSNHSASLQHKATYPTRAPPSTPW